MAATHGQDGILSLVKENSFLLCNLKDLSVTLSCGEKTVRRVKLTTGTFEKHHRSEEKADNFVGDPTLKTHDKFRFTASTKADTKATKPQGLCPLWVP